MLPDNRFKLLSDESDNNITIIGTHKEPLKCNNSYPMSFYIANWYCQCHTASITREEADSLSQQLITM